jgi:hypothetical protein
MFKRKYSRAIQLRRVVEIAIVMFFVVVFLIEGSTGPGYSAWRNFVDGPVDDDARLHVRVPTSVVLKRVPLTIAPARSVLSWVAGFA